MNPRRVTKVAVLAIAFLWAGYAITSNAQALTTSSLTSLHASQSTIRNPQSIEDEYPSLPKDVAHSVQSIVAIQRITSKSSQNNAVIASGVILNDHQVLTAGHATQANGSLSCTNTSVDAQGYLTAAAASANPVTYASAIHNDVNDLAVLSVQADQNYKSLPYISVAANMPKAGDTVYFINFQPEADGTVRNPLSDTAGDPVVFSGTVVGHDSQGLQIAAGGGTSYGHGQPETLLRKGASGGAIVNARGQLVGLSVSSDSLAPNQTAASIGTNFGIALPKGRYQIVNAQTLSTDLVTKLQTSMVACR